MECIKNFITEEERVHLVAWVYKYRDFYTQNDIAPFRFYSIIEETPENEVAIDVLLRMREELSRSNPCTSRIEPQWLGNFISFIEPGGFVHMHKDEENRGSHFRYNLILQKPELGGDPIYGGKVLEWEERALLKYRPDQFEHGSAPVKGVIPRITLSAGWVLYD